MKIGSFNIHPLVMSAPLAGITDTAFLKILSELKTPLLFTEMIPAISLAKNPKTMIRLLNWSTEIHPICAQLFGSQAWAMAEAARILVDLGADMIDLNMGCPAKKIVRSGAGIALMKEPVLAGGIMRSVRLAVSCPVSVKIRLGIDPITPNALLFAQMAQDSGLEFVTIHGRYRTGYDIPADWHSIAEVRRNVSIPIIGNGDIFSTEDARRMMTETGCDGVMIGRGITGNPWLPGIIARNLYETTEGNHTIALQERIRVLLQHLRFLVEQNGPQRASLIFRKHSAWYLKGLPNSLQDRKRLFTFSRPEEYEAFAQELLDRNNDTPSSVTE